AYLGQLALSEHAGNLSMAINDVTRVVEEIRRRNNPCVVAVTGNPPTARPPEQSPGVFFTSWDAWLADQTSAGGGGRSMGGVNNSAANPFFERIMVTCRSADNAAYCGQSQVGTAEWNYAASNPAVTQDPIRVTVAVCWRHRNRVVGECKWDAGTSSWDATPSTWDLEVAYPGTDTADVIESPAMVGTVVVCRFRQ
ncbi:MAG: hypothetical protein HY598_02335, partial [Candidatus Omnitrophica bacterium]|nr:hypothetical protein [Candidatus Omnitrophota bacterium]